jgi:hypothetical protein
VRQRESERERARERERERERADATGDALFNEHRWSGRGWVVGNTVRRYFVTKWVREGLTDDRRYT